MGQNNATALSAEINDIDALQWLIDIGVDECVSDAPVNAFEIKPVAKSAPLYGQSQNQNLNNGVATPSASVTAQITAQAVQPNTGGEGHDLIPKRVSATTLGTAEAGEEARKLASDVKTLDELKEVMANFDGCALKRTAENMVFADGNPQAKIMLVGEAPGDIEDRQGKPFQGVRGRLLDKMLQSIGLDREQVYLTDLVNWRPLGNRGASPSDIAVCLPFVKRHIELVQPEFVIFVGGVAAKTLLETSRSITQLRGKWTEYKSDGLDAPIQATAMLHPDYLISTPTAKALAWKDLLALKAKLAN